METSQIKAFLAVAREQSFSKAAKSIFRTQPTVTMAVQRLEKELGARLFDRLGRKVRLTAVGEALRDIAGPLLMDWEGVENRLKGRLAGKPQGPVSLGVGESAMLYLLPDAIRRFRKKHPQVDVQIRNQTSEQTLAELKRGDLDFGFRSLSGATPPLFFHPVSTHNRVLIVPKGHSLAKANRITLKELSKHPFVIPWERSVTRQMVEEAFRGEGLPLKISLETGGYEIIKKYVALGLGIAVVLEFCLKPEDRKQLAVRPVHHLFKPDTYGVVVRQGRPLSEAAKALIRTIAPGFPRQYMG